MKLSEYIINDIMPLHSKGKVSELQLMFNQLSYSHIPVQNDDNIFIGSFFETDAHCFDGEKSISEYI